MTTTSNVGSNPYAALGLTGNSGSSTSKTTSAADAAAAAAATSINQQDFLKLMTTQLQTQNPLQPVTNAEFFSQIAQFSTVSGVNQLNANFSALASQLSSSQALQAASLVGHGVLVAGSDTQLTSAGLLGAVEVPSSGDVVVQIKNSAGAVVDTLDLGTQSAGTVPFTWDGKDAAGNAFPTGNYSISATVSTSTGSAAAQTDVGALVESVSVDTSNGLMLNLQGHGLTAFSQVRQII